MAKVFDLGAYRVEVESRGDGPVLFDVGGWCDNWWPIYDEVVENVGLMPDWMVLKLMSVCRGRLRDAKTT